jgi:cytochrome bd ubiquinol oxidase subunit II
MHSDAPFLYHGLTHEGLPLVILSALCGLGVLFVLRRGNARVARPLAVGAVVAVVWGWGAAQYPYLLPEQLKIAAGAAPSATLTGVLIVFGAAVLLVLPAIAVLFRLTQRGLLEETSKPAA